MVNNPPCSTTRAASTAIRLAALRRLRYRSHRFSQTNRVTTDFSSLDHRLTPRGRLSLAVGGLIGLALLPVARNLQPDPRGWGTHEQLGLTPCFLYRSTGMLCPTCGATTAWAHLLRGEIASAAASNLASTLLCGAVLLAVPWALLSALVGRWVLVAPRWNWLLAIAAGWFALALIDWLQRVVRHW